MKDLLKAGQILGRDELKKIMAGSGESNPTNCILCEGGTMYCTKFNGMTPGPGCSWGHCPCP